MKKRLHATQKKAMWPVSIITAAICLLLSINAIAQAPPPTDPYVANVLDYGAVGNCTLVGNTWTGTDNTAAIQNAINDVSQNHPGGTVLVPDGTYLVTKPAGSNEVLNLKSNITFKITSGATIQLKENNAGTYGIIMITGKTNVNVTGGGMVRGERHQHLTPGDFINHSSYGEWGMGLWIGSASSHIYVDGVSFTECWGDGIYIGAGAASTDVTIFGVVCDDNRRQGMSITWADGVLVQKSSFNNTSGTSPMAGIDLEPNTGNYVKNVQILNNQFINNLSKGLLMYSSPSPNPEISNITVTGNTISGANWGIGVNNTRSGITVSNNILTNQVIDAIGVAGSMSVNNNYTYNTISASPARTGDKVAIRFTDGATGNKAIHNTISGFPLYNGNQVKDEVGGNTISPNP